MSYDVVCVLHELSPDDPTVEAVTVVGGLACCWRCAEQTVAALTRGYSVLEILSDARDGGWIP